MDENMELPFENEIRLTELADSCGCAAKLEPRLLAGVLEGIGRGSDDNLLVGAETSDDGAIYRINDQVAMIQTLDFFPPMVDDPWDFGQVAAANALSDIYAMGGEPKVALNIAAFPSGLDTGILKKILEGGASKILEAGAVMAGGHTIRDKTPKYGLSVSGFVHPDRIWKNCSARPGDVLVLTKPLGVGVINTAVKARLASPEAARSVLQVMTTLNRYARDVACGHHRVRPPGPCAGDGQGQPGDHPPEGGADSGALLGRRICLHGTGAGGRLPEQGICGRPDPDAPGGGVDAGSAV